MCILFWRTDGKLHQLNQVDFQTKKKSSSRKITGFQVILLFASNLSYYCFYSSPRDKGYKFISEQFSPSNPSEVLVTSADSRIRILDGLDIVHKFRGIFSEIGSTCLFSLIQGCSFWSLSPLTMMHTLYQNRFPKYQQSNFSCIQCRWKIYYKCK